MAEDDIAVVVPLVQSPARLNTENMLRMLLNREAILSQRPRRGYTNQTATDMVAPAASAFSRAMSEVTRQFVRSNTGASDLFRVIMPAGTTIKDLSQAVGGGFRGLVRNSKGTITGHARFIPAGTAAAGSIAVGPLIATVSLAMASEMLAQHQMTKKLDSIRNAVTGISERMDAEERSVLTSAEQQTRHLVSYLLDRAEMPSISSASYVFGQLDVLTNQYAEKLDIWSEVIEKYRDSEHVYGPVLMGQLIGENENQIQEFERLASQAYEAFALRSRVYVLEGAVAEFSNPDKTLREVEKSIQGELRRMASKQSQLVDVIDNLNVMSIDSSSLPVRYAGKRSLSIRSSFAKLARALHAAPDALPVLTDNEQGILELESSNDGFTVPSSSGTN